MGGHGGLNILPQKRWNVYNFDNREKVKKDEEAAAKEEQLKREQLRKRDAEFRLEQLRTARGLAPTIQPSAPSAPPVSESSSAPPVSDSSSAPPVSESRHINLFEGIKVFDIMAGGGEGERGVEKEGHKKKKMKKEEPAPRVVTAEDEKYRLGYGVAGKGVKLPWYLARPSDGKNDGSAGDNDMSRLGKEGSKSGGKKTIEELREERLRREKREKERTLALIQDKGRRDLAVPEDRYISRSRRGLGRLYI